MAGKLNISLDVDRIKSGTTNVFLKSFSETNKVIKNIPLDKIDDFPEHPFKVVRDDDMLKLIESIKENGILTPIIVTEKEDGRYYCISGHRRRYASNEIGLNTIPAITEDLNDEDAVIAMVDTNLQREKILPSEKARAYKMKLEAIKRQGCRTDLTTSLPMGGKLSEEYINDVTSKNDQTCRPSVDKLKSSDVMGAENGDSGRQVQRYIRLTYLIPELLELVDRETLGFRCAVELSFLREKEQNILYSKYISNDIIPSIKQCEELKRASKKAPLLLTDIEFYLKSEKPQDTYESKKSASVTAPKNKNDIRSKYAGIIKGYLLKAINQLKQEQSPLAISESGLSSLLQRIDELLTKFDKDDAYIYYIKSNIN